MALSASLTELQSEASCPLCKDYLRDPVTLECGHNFCGSCIQERWEGLEDIFPCPVCLHHCPDRNFKRNNQLCHIMAMVKQLPVRRNKRKRQGEKLCEKHGEVMDVFCEEDLALLCPQCRASPEHRDHHLVPAEIAAESQRKKLKGYTKLLKTQIVATERESKLQISKFLEETWKVENRKRELGPECTEVNLFLRREHSAANATLTMEEKKEEDRLTQNKSYISGHVDICKTLLREASEKSLLPNLELLSSLRSIPSRDSDLPLPVVLSYELKKESLSLPPHYFGLNNMINTFQEDLTLDVATAHSSLTISKDRKRLFASVAQSGDKTQMFASFPAVLCCEGFDGGRHFWQVEVTGTGEWSLGVCKESFCSKGPMLPTPDNGCWAFLQTAKFAGPDGAMEQVHHGMKFGVFLDYELGEISIYHLNSRLYICKTTGNFTGKLKPYFAVGSSSQSFSIRLATEER